MGCTHGYCDGCHEMTCDGPCKEVERKTAENPIGLLVCQTCMKELVAWVKGGMK